MSKSLSKETFMKNYEINQLFQAKMQASDSDDEDNPLSQPHKFLKMAILETSGVSDCEIGNIEMPARNLRIDGYYDDEDEKIFHVLGLIYFPKFEASINDFLEAFQATQNQIYSFFLLGLQKDIDSLLTTSSVFEAIMALKDALASGYSLEIDYLSNLDFPVELNGKDVITLNKVDVKQIFYGASEIYESITSNESSNLIIDIRNDYGACLYGLRISSTKDFDIYLTSIPGKLLAKIYNNHKSRLLEGNVRSYLKRTQKTNSGIVKTLQNVPSEFVAYNNGLSTVASASGTEIKTINGNFVEINVLNQLQIVNGGQTTVTIYECSKDPIDLTDVIVPMKLTILKRRENEAEMVSNISRYANTQTAIAKSDLSSNEPFYKEMEKLSRNTPCYKDGIVASNNEYFWFFERSNGQYNTEKRVIYNYSKSFSRRYPDKLKFSKKILAKAIMAYQKHPDTVCLGNEKNFVAFNEYIIENCIIPNERYYKRFIGALILWRSVDKIILKAKLPIKAAVLPYTISKMSYIYKSLIDLDKIWADQKVDKNLEAAALDIATKISKHFQSNIDKYPNTLMWGRKSDCWDEIKKLPVTALSINLCHEPIDFMPQNPANKYIDIRQNLINPSLWNRILLWNAASKALSTQQEKTIKEFINSLRLSMGTGILPYTVKKMKELFMKAVRNGFPYKEVM